MIWKKMELSFLPETQAETMWRAVRRLCNEKYRMVEKYESLEYDGRPNNHTRWNHKWVGTTRLLQSGLWTADNKDILLTSAMMSVKHSVAHRPKSEKLSDRTKKIKKR